ncbi:hypothetical protein N6Y36_06340 [Morganella morganii]|nr:hypothetical protein N6Y36_06340 [Morganella morganii]
MKIFTKNKMKFIFVLIFIILMIIYCFYFTVSDDTFFKFFSDSLLPEFIGVCLEFIVILFFIDYMQKKRTGIEKSYPKKG